MNRSLCKGKMNKNIKFSSPEHHKKRKIFQISIPFFGAYGKGTVHSIYASKYDYNLLKRLKLVEEIKNKILDDCIKNPARYLE